MNGAITKQDVIKYESIRRSGKFNMIMDSLTVMTIIWPNKSKFEKMQLYNFLVYNFSDLKEKYFLDDNYNYPVFNYNVETSYSFE